MATLLNETDLIDRILAHIDGKTTDKGAMVWREPVENYHSAERFAAELEVMRRVPMAFARRRHCRSRAPTSRARRSARRYWWCAVPTAWCAAFVTPAAIAA